MISARIYKYWNDVDLRQQTPGNLGFWRGIRFLFEGSGFSDYTILHGHGGSLRLTVCRPEGVWLVLGEPPNSRFDHMQNAPSWVRRVYMTDETRASSRYVLTHAGLPWHAGKSFDYLTALPPLAKDRDLSWITSDRVDTPGHRFRIDFLNALRAGDVDFDLFGRGFEPIASKWDGLARYRYSVAFENFSNAWYWTEKVMDCFLSWTMPLYYGCVDLGRFFPRESFVQLDPSSPDVVDQIRRVVASDLRERNLDAIAESRRRVLYDYNFFELMTSEIERAEAAAARRWFRPKLPRLIYDHTTPLGNQLWMAVKRQVKRPVKAATRFAGSLPHRA